MRHIICAAGFGILILMCFGIVKMRGQLIKEGNKILLLQKELWELKDRHDKLMNMYGLIVTPENMLLKRRELCRSLSPPDRVILVKEKERQENTVSMKHETGIEKRNVEP